MAGGHRRHAKFLTGGSLSFSDVLSDWTTLVTFGSDSAIIALINTLNQDIEIRFPNEDGTTGGCILPARASASLDFVASNLQMSAGTVAVKYVSAAPTSGRISILGVT